MPSRTGEPRRARYVELYTPIHCECIIMCSYTAVEVRNIFDQSIFLWPCNLQGIAQGLRQDYFGTVCFDCSQVWGASMVGVGMASTMFHASSGAWREWGRRMDYWSIAASSSLLLRAVYPKTPTSVTIASMAMIPFKPFLVSSFNSAAM